MAIGDLKKRLRARFTGRQSAASSVSSAEGGVDGDRERNGQARVQNHSSTKSRSLRSRGSQRPESTIAAPAIDERESGKADVGDAQGAQEKREVVHREASSSSSGGGSGQLRFDTPGLYRSSSHAPETTKPNSSTSTADTPTTTTSTSLASKPLPAKKRDELSTHDSVSTTDFPTPYTDIAPVPEEYEGDDAAANDAGTSTSIVDAAFSSPVVSTAASNPASDVRPADLERRQSLLPHQQTRLIHTLLQTQLPTRSSAANLEYFASNGPSTVSANMVSRKIWVRRPGASATLVTIHEDDLVDDVREMILKKYANSLGRSFDAPDVTLRIVPRENRQERTLGPEEPMGRTLDAYFQGGQTVDEALLIDVPLRRTPKASPRSYVYYDDERRPTEGGSDYFPPMPVAAMPSPHLPNSVPAGVNGQLHAPLASHSMSVLTTGHVPSLPSPGSVRRHHRDRPRLGRQHTPSPAVIGGQAQPVPPHNGIAYPIRVPHERTHSSASEKSLSISAAPPPPPALPTPPPPQVDILQVQRVATPPPRVSSPRPTNRARRTKKAVDHPSLPTGMLNSAVPPINVLIVEDNIINLKLLEAFMKRLRVRWQTAMNGREAVNKWRGGGFHLVLMDIQLPIMNGLEATKEIRRLERLNSIGVFSSSASSVAPSEGAQEGELESEDKLLNMVLFKSPVIIVALTASSLQSDRHEALAAGCNDFLTKPVNFVWLERKVMEWGCMQALIDFDGWRKWKDFSQGNKEDEKDTGGKKSGLGGGGGGGGAKKKKNRTSVGSNPGASSAG